MKSRKKAEIPAAVEPTTRVRGGPPAETLAAGADLAGTKTGDRCSSCLLRNRDPAVAGPGGFVGTF